MACQARVDTERSQQEVQLCTYSLEMVQEISVQFIQTCIYAQIRSHILFRDVFAYDPIVTSLGFSFTKLNQRRSTAC